MNAITYFKLKSPYEGDITKNCALTGSEVDNNFYTLESRDVKSVELKDDKIVVNLMNGEKLTTEDKIYATQFYQWLKRYLQKYIHNVYTVAHYIVYTRIWHYQDCRNLKKTKKIDEMCDFFEKIYSTDKH